MNKIITPTRIFVSVLLLFLVAVLVVAMVMPSLGFFKVIFDRVGFNSAKVELIFDRLTVTDELKALGYDDSEEWGTEKNPYVISEKYHVQNLSVLQNNGFFKETRTAQSFFLVCTSDGLPVAIDCEGMTLAPVGTHDNPFTGVIKGAPLEGEAEYTYVPRSSDDGTVEETYGVSTSTIGNLIVEANLSEPDIGFFGCIGYSGTATTDPETGAPAISGYAANIQDILLADVTISAAPSLAESLLAWWNDFTGHKTTAGVVGAEGVDVSATGNKETHHIGVVAGHAEYATVNNISVFYTQGVQTFALSGSSYINYYSTTGLVGMLHYVNPTIKSGNMLVGDGNSVSDGDMVEGGLGGGGTISGTLTGYMLAETLFSEHESCLTEQNVTTKKDAYNVTEMQKHNTESDTPKYKGLFESVVMNVGSKLSPKEVTYYFFRDSVFTFAMSASSETAGADNADYVMKIWKLEETRPSLSGTANFTDWNYSSSTNPADIKRAYKLTAIKDKANITANGYYVIGYQDNGADDVAGTADDVLYIFPINNTSTNQGVWDDVLYSEFLQGSVSLNTGETIKIPGPVYENGSLSSVTLVGKEKVFYDSAFLYQSGKILTNPAATSYALAVTSTRNTSGYTATDSFPMPTASTIQTSTKPSKPSGGRNETEAVSYNWQIVEGETDGKFAIYLSFTFDVGTTLGTVFGGSRYTNGLVNFRISNGMMSYNIQGGKSDNSISYPNADIYVPASDYCFSIFQITPNTLDSNNEVIAASGNYELTPMSMVPTNPTYSYDPSQYVLQPGANGAYSLLPLASLNLNNGKGVKLEELNHVIRMYEATKYNGKLTIGSTIDELLGTDFFGGLFDSDSGGVVGAYIGTTGKYYTIPAGMVAFYIDEETTDADHPSYINIIVAIEPGQTVSGEIGLYQTTTNNTGNEFNLGSPMDSFVLPCSVVATSNTFRDKYTVTVSDRTIPVQNADGTVTYTVDNTDSYLYLNGETAFVYYTFEVKAGGIYMLGSKTGPMSVAYFSVTGAAGQGADGTSTSPLGDIDFVYANGGKIVTIDKKFEGIQDPTNENHALYYPSYHFIVMKGEGTTAKPFVQNEIIKVHRYIYIDPNDSSATKRHIKIIGCTNAKPTGLADMYEDDLEE